MSVGNLRGLVQFIPAEKLKVKVFFEELAFLLFSYQ
jgi:hypothetical protein